MSSLTVFPEYILGRVNQEIAHVQHLDRLHHLIVHVLLWLGPVDGNRVAPELSPARDQLPTCHCRRAMRAILDKGKTSIFVLVSRRGIDNHILDLVSHFAQLGQNFVLFARLRDAADKQAAIVDRGAHAERSTLANLVIVEFGNGRSCVATNNV